MSRVLVVDDEALTRTMLADIVRSCGHDAETAASGEEGMASFRRGRFQLVLTDVTMPGMDGMEVLAELGRRDMLRALPVVMVTALDDRQARLGALRAGAVDFITKPIDRIEVACKMRALVELSRLRSESVRGLKRRAADELLARVDSAVAGLPLLIYEMSGNTPASSPG